MQKRAQLGREKIGSPFNSALGHTRLSISSPTDIKMTWDAFISHASEDKDAAARPIAEKLKAKGLRIWFDECSLRVGDSLRRSIDEGLKSSHFGIVILSPAFFQKHWPQSELDGLFSREVHGKKVILPVWYNLGFEEVVSNSPMLADRVAISLSAGLDDAVARLLDVIQPEAFAACECVEYLTDRCGFEVEIVRDAMLEASNFEEFVTLLISISGRRDMWLGMTATFELPNARVGLNNAREVLGLRKFDYEFF